MNKSEFLDDLRLEIGLVGDYAKNLKDFYFGIIQVFGKYSNHESGIGIYYVKDYIFQLLGCVGHYGFQEQERFGDGLLSMCAIKGRIVIEHLASYKCILTPFYQKHDLLGIIVIKLSNDIYEVSEEDIVFLHEVSRFIEAQQKRYKKVR